MTLGAVACSLTFAKTPTQVWGIKCDVSDKKDVEALTEFAKDKCGTVHYWYWSSRPMQRQTRTRSLFPRTEQRIARQAFVCRRRRLIQSLGGK